MVMRNKGLLWVRTGWLLAALLLYPFPLHAADLYEVDHVHSSIVFRIKHLEIAYVYGRFNDFSGTFRIDDNNPANNTIEIQVKAKSIDTANAKRDAHLRSPDFFDVKQFPLISFNSKSFKTEGSDLFEVAGDLSLHGITHPLTIKVERTGSGRDPWGGYRVGFEGTFRVNRSEFGMSHMLGPVGDEVRLTVSLEAIRKS